MPVVRKLNPQFQLDVQTSSFWTSTIDVCLKVKLKSEQKFGVKESGRLGLSQRLKSKHSLGLLKHTNSRQTHATLTSYIQTSSASLDH